MNSPTIRADHLRAALRDAGWTNTDLWIAGVAIGTRLSFADVEAVMNGDRSTSRTEYDTLAAACNDHFSDVGRDHPVPYWMVLEHSG